ncbi:hypothetical protein [Helicobacter sp. 23-1045]
MSVANTTKQSKKNKMDCHDFATQNLAMTGNSKLDSAFHAKIAESATNSQNLKRDSSLRASTSRENDKIDCHDSASQNLAMTESNTDSAICTNFAESHAKS